MIPFADNSPSLQTNLIFNREITLGMRLDIPAGTAIRFEPGDTTEVRLVSYSGYRNVFGFNALINYPARKLSIISTSNFYETE